MTFDMLAVSWWNSILKFTFRYVAIYRRQLLPICDILKMGTAGSLRNIGVCLAERTASQPRRQWPQWGSQITRTARQPEVRRRPLLNSRPKHLTQFHFLTPSLFDCFNIILILSPSETVSELKTKAQPRNVIVWWYVLILSPSTQRYRKWHLLFRCSYILCACFIFPMRATRHYPTTIIFTQCCYCYYCMYRTRNCLLFCMGVKLGRWHWRSNVGWGCLRIGCWGEYLGLRGTR